MTTSLTVPTFTRQHNKWRGCKEANDIHSAKIDKCIKGAVLHRARMGQATAAINNFNSCTTALTTPAVWETAKTCKIMWRKSVERFPRYPLKTTFFVPGFDLQPSKGPNMSSVWICCKSVQRLLRYLPKIPFFCPRWPWHSNSSKWGTKHVFPMNLAQSCTAVPEIFHTQTKTSHTQPKTEPYTVHCMW